MHKKTCAGGPPEPKEKVIAEGDACLVGFLSVEIKGEEDIASLAASLASLIAQEEPLQALCISWYASQQDLKDKTRSMLDDKRLQNSSPQFVVVEAEASMKGFQHIKALLGALPADLPSHAWVKFPESGCLWSRKHAALLIPALRRAAPDQRIVAVTCQAYASSEQSQNTTPASAGAVDTLLEAGDAKLQQDGLEMRLDNLAVRLKTLKAFVESTPASALGDQLCAHRFQCKLVSAFGRKVNTFTAPAGEWMYWMPRSRVPAASQTCNGLDLDLSPSDTDIQGAAFLQDGFQRFMAQAGTPAADSAATLAEASDRENDTTKVEHLGTRLSLETMEQATRAMTTLRLRVEQAIIVSAGDKMSARELRAAATEQMHAFMDEVGLGQVIGLERWARETTDEISLSAAKRFQVQVTAGQE